MSPGLSRMTWRVNGEGHRARDRAHSCHLRRRFPTGAPEHRARVRLEHRHVRFSVSSGSDKLGTSLSLKAASGG